jgi:hypothetical protein
MKRTNSEFVANQVAVGLGAGRSAGAFFMVLLLAGFVYLIAS